MTDSQWRDLKYLIEGRSIGYQPAGFIIDSPWIPGWYGISVVDYYASDELWLKANLAAVSRFPDIWFLPGFWSEYGMCTEPSAFGSRMIFNEKSLPHAMKIIDDVAQAASLPQPDVRTDGLLPFMISRLRNNNAKIRDNGHEIRFAVSRGPLNIASFLMGTTEFMLALATDPDASHKLLRKITDFVCDWLLWQKECFPTIEGSLILDDLIGFVGVTEFDEFVTPYLRRIFSCLGSEVRFLHNDAEGLITAGKLNELNVNMFNFSFNHSMDNIRKLAGKDVVLVGNIPPRDVLADGSETDVENAVKKSCRELADHCAVIWSAGGGMPPGVKDKNIIAFKAAVEKYGDKIKL